MTISNKAKYGLRILMMMATDPAPLTSVQKIYEQEDVSRRYLEQIFSDLKKHGLVKSIKGKHGGYQMGKDLWNITVLDVIQALEGHEALGSLPTPGNPDMEDVFSQYLWQPLQKEMEVILKGVTLEKLLDEYNSTQANMFYI